jgi:hypothetical protein
MSKYRTRVREIFSNNLAYWLHEGKTASQKVGREAGPLTEKNLAAA